MSFQTGVPSARTTLRWEQQSARSTTATCDKDANTRNCVSLRSTRGLCCDLKRVICISPSIYVAQVFHGTTDSLIQQMHPSSSLRFIWSGAGAPCSQGTTKLSHQLAVHIPPPLHRVSIERFEQSCLCSLASQTQASHVLRYCCEVVSQCLLLRLGLWDHTYDIL